MNERILKLREQAGLQPYYDAQEQQIEKFAELVVRECSQVAAQTHCPYEDEFAKQTYGHTWDMACVESAKNIRKHFGVEE